MNPFPLPPLAPVYLIIEDQLEGAPEVLGVFLDEGLAREFAKRTGGEVKVWTADRPKTDWRVPWVDVRLDAHMTLRHTWDIKVREVNHGVLMWGGDPDRIQLNQPSVSFGCYWAWDQTDPATGKFDRAFGRIYAASKREGVRLIKAAFRLAEARLAEMEAKAPRFDLAAQEARERQCPQTSASGNFSITNAVLSQLTPREVTEISATQAPAVPEGGWPSKGGLLH